MKMILNSIKLTSENFWKIQKTCKDKFRSLKSRVVKSNNKKNYFQIKRIVLNFKNNK